MRYIESRAPPALEYSTVRVSVSLHLYHRMTMRPDISHHDTARLVVDLRPSHLENTLPNETLHFLTRFRLLELAPVTCDVPSTTIGIAELISVHLSSPAAPATQPGGAWQPDSFSIAAEIPAT